MEKSIQHILQENLIKLRKSRKLTQIELGEKISYSDKTISKWENGESCPNIEAIYKLAAFYHVSIDALVRPDISVEEMEEIEDEETKKKKIRYSKLIITLLAVISAWAIATLVFVYISFLNVSGAWLAFIYAIPVSFIVIIVFNSIWGRRRWNYLWITFLLWTALTTIFLQFIAYAPWMVFLIGIPVQVAILLWSGLKK